MPEGIKRKSVKVPISVVAYQQLAKLAEGKEQTVSEYIRSLVTQHLEEQGLPIYFDPDAIPKL